MSTSSRTESRAAVARPPAPAPLVSVVVPAFRAGATIGACVRGLLASTYERLEVIVVSDGGPAEAARHPVPAGARHCHVECRKGAAFCRNYGVSKAAGEIVAFVDADVVVQPDTVERMVEHLSSGEADAVFGMYAADTPTRGAVSKFKNLQHHFTHMTNAGPAKTFWTACGGVWKSSFEKARGFDPSVQFMEDINIGHKLVRAKQRIALSPSIICRHLKDYSLLSLLRSDLFGRAVPWSELILSGRGAVALNASLEGAVGVALTFCLVPALALAAYDWRLAALAGAIELGTAYINRDFLAYVARREGLSFALLSFALQHLYYANCGIGMAIALWGRAKKALAAPSRAAGFDL